MRTIKFRAWDDELKCFLWFDKPTQLTFWKGIAKYDLPIMQFTGLCDKGGNEIYEGDIVKCHDYYGWRNSVVEFNEKYAIFSASSKHIHGMGRDSGKPLFISPRTTTVIGNIYENPELL
jgi:uncharacterized phage protein (TIGR01671 family)